MRVCDVLYRYSYVFIGRARCNLAQFCRLYMDGWPEAVMSTDSAKDDRASPLHTCIAAVDKWQLQADIDRSQIDGLARVVKVRELSPLLRFEPPVDSEKWSFMHKMCPIPHPIDSSVPWAYSSWRSLTKISRGLEVRSIILISVNTFRCYWW